ncbi:DUF5004 domain-containing protein [Marinilongibacter aquaticus]|uniref:DUF5004 domain-containing protein n=1 Tax=Marinilongibacter aquaticus TaxID=2975157 RepID=UPI0021BD657D|nr:DUF5004 domain-containing protein [Marinilongibacter aquaticus]UBM60480.1 DUF5004 domain-containing protein [Marinilongibacter aquaticus]
MKTKFFKVFSLLLFTALIVSCSKDKDEDTTPEDALEGSWKISGITIIASDDTETDYYTTLKAESPCVTDLTYVFASGKYTVENATSCSTENNDVLAILTAPGTYSIDGNSFTMTISGFNVDGEISGSSATISSINPLDLTSKLRITLTKQ